MNPCWVEVTNSHPADLDGGLFQMNPCWVEVAIKAVSQHGKMSFR